MMVVAFWLVSVVLAAVLGYLACATNGDRLIYGYGPRRDR